MYRSFSLQFLRCRIVCLCGLYKSINIFELLGARAGCANRLRGPGFQLLRSRFPVFLGPVGSLDIYLLMNFRSGFGAFWGFSSFRPLPGATKLPAGPTFWPRQPFWRPCRPIFPSKTTFWRLYRPILPYKTTFRRVFSPILLLLNDETCMTDPSIHKFHKDCCSYLMTKHA